MNYDKLKPLFQDKRAVILGLGREGRNWLDIIRGLHCCREIAIADINPLELEIRNVTPISGDNYLEICKEYDIILQSPGVIIKDAYDDEEKGKIISQTEMLMRLHPCKIIGVTGTKGKSTTASLTYHFLKSCGIKTMLIGNIGVPPLQRLEEMTEDTVAVCEMSCHQLEFVSHSPDIAVLLNIYPEHLDHYVSFDAYAQAKRNIVRFQESGATALVNKELLPVDCGANIKTMSFGSEADVWTDGSDIYVFGEKIPAEKIQTGLRGKHNLYNIAAALAAAVTAGADLNKCLEALKTFRGLEHRLEYVATKNGVEYINDSISTVPEATIAAVKAFDGTDCLILGGMDRGISYDLLGEFLNSGIVENVILLPDSGRRIAHLIKNHRVNVIKAADMEEAVKFASRCAKTRVILSPAAASYGFYRNFEERGRDFKRLVNELK